MSNIVNHQFRSNSKMEKKETSANLTLVYLGKNIPNLTSYNAEFQHVYFS